MKSDGRHPQSALSKFSPTAKLSSMSDDVVSQEAREQAELFKEEGNRFLKAKDYDQAIEFYTRAIDLDPENAVYFSNRSAAYLAQGDSRGKALKDAEKCIELKPDWWKGYSRKGAAEHALQRFDAARATYNLGLKLDPDNQSLQQAAEDSYQAGQLHSQRLRAFAKEQERLQQEQLQRDKALEQARAKAKEEEEEATQRQALAAPKTEEDLLAEFMTEVQELEDQTNCIQKPKEDSGGDDPATQDPKTKHKPKRPVEFGDSEGQLVRLLQEHYKWINLNPFRVLMLDTDATEEDMKQHYRKISTLVHPDKFNHPRAREAFEEVAKAYEILCNQDRRKTCIRLIENTREKTIKDRHQKLKKGFREADLGDLEDEMERNVLKSFAEVENRRLNLEKREAAQRRREAEQQDKEQEEMTNSYKRERSWAEVDRREARVGNWRGFQKDGKRRKPMDARSWKEEKREEDAKHGVVDNDQYKRAWR